MSDIKKIIERNERRKHLIAVGAAANSNEFVEQVYELKEINRLTTADFDSLITTIESLQKEKDEQHDTFYNEVRFAYQQIESQKKEIEKKDAALLAWMEREEKLKAGFDQLESKQIESLKAITELAVNGFEEVKIALKYATSLGHLSTCTCPSCNALGTAEYSLFEIERLSHE